MKNKKTKEQALSELTQYFQVKGEKQGWHGMEMQSKNVVMIDPGTGKPYTWRQWTFKFDSKIMEQIKQRKIPMPTKQELFNSNWKQIRVQLWGDGWKAREDIEPKLLMGKDNYQIIICCEPRLNVMVNDKTKTLQDVFKPRK